MLGVFSRMSFAWLGGLTRAFVLSLAVSFCCAGSASPAAAQTVINVSASSFQDYTVDGLSDPTLTLTRGRTYQFVVNAPGHPFYIKSVQGAGTANQFLDGVTGNGVTAGTLTFVVPASAPNQLFYQCAAHGAMSGMLSVVSAPAAPVPSGSLGLLVVTAFVMLALGAALAPRLLRSSPRA